MSEPTKPSRLETRDLLALIEAVVAADMREIEATMILPSLTITVKAKR
jgi:hypothetical protein